MNDTSLNELTKKGEYIYFSQLKEKLEKTNLGDYVVIEVDTGKHFIDKDEVAAINKAKERFPKKLFFIAKIGNLREASMSAKINKSYAWIL